MKKLLFGGLCVALALGSFMLTHHETSTPTVSALALANLNALSNPEGETSNPELGNTETGSGIGNPETGFDFGNTEQGGNTPEEICRQSGGNWNMASVCVESGFQTSKCVISGEVSLFGVTIKGSYEKNKAYEVPWARYQCQPSPGNCCTKQGLYTGDTKLA